MSPQQRLCYDCDNELPLGASFCSNCGRQIRKRSERLDEHAKRKEQRLAEQAITNAGREAYENYRKELARRAARRNPVTWGLFLIFALTAIIKYFLSEDTTIATIFAVMAVLSAFFSINPNRWLSTEEYYSLPGSRFDNGQHRCIFCGAKGVYRKGEYRTNNTYAKCSKCEHHLFIE